jgi:rhomboid protease GluP
MKQGLLPLIGLILGPILIVVPLGLIIGARWSWQTAKSKGRTERSFLGHFFSGEGRGFIPKEETFEGLLARSNPWCFITLIIITLNVLIFIAMALSGSLLSTLLDPEIEQLLLWGANYGPLTIRGEWWRLLSSTFLHAGFLHLFFNMLFFWVLGNYAERMFGNLTFLMLYALSGLGGSVATLLWNPNVVSLGASGAILGVAGATAMFLLLQKPHIKRAAQKSNLLIMLAYLGYNFAFGFGKSGIDNAGHLGGLFVGIAIGRGLYRPLQG